MKKKIVFIINPKSGTSKKELIPELIWSELDQTIFEPEVLFTEYRGHGSELARMYVKEGVDYVVAVGGDGTVNEVARELIHSATALGIVPVGSGNGLARHLNIPMSPRKAIEQLNHSEPIWIDYGLVNNQPFFCTCGTGFDAYVSTEFAKGKHRGVMSYLEKIITGYFSYKTQNYHLLGDGIDIKASAFVLTFANASQWGNNAYIAPQASVQDGKIDISMMSSFPIIAIPSLALQLFTKTIDKDFFMSTLRAKEVTLKRDEPGPFHYDGEPYEEGTEINIRVVPDGLKVLTRKRF
ncbi:MAG: diacylglycerol kinase catalytic region [Bacteroidetes bacterium]|jgi:YegS/Rv2252/BmrU family lipid kinase|nr:diacylglycerol kinase catalytic region [Bacteroidota bacterium]